MATRMNLNTIPASWKSTLMSAHKSQAFTKKRTVCSTKKNDSRLIIPEGERNTYLVKQAGHFRREGYSDAQIKPMLLVINEKVCHPPRAG